MDLRQGDCLEIMPTIPSESVDMVLCDPPYGTIKISDNHNIKRTDWDIKIDTQKLFFQLERLLRKNGTCALFSQEPYTTELITSGNSNLGFSYRYTWLKNNFSNYLGVKKAPANYTEDVCVFFKKYSLESGPLREYSKKCFEWIGKNLKQINKILGDRTAEHFFYFDSIQHELCLEKTYSRLIDSFKLRNMPGFLEYEALEALELPRVFNLQGERFKPNILEYDKPTNPVHSTQKPTDLLEDLIRTYTNPGDTVLDFTMGSGSTGVACKNTGRKFIGIEKDAEYFEIAKRRIAEMPQPVQVAENVEQTILFEVAA